MKTTIFLAAMMIVGAVAVVPSASAADVLDLDSGGSGSGCSHLPYLAELYCRAKEAICALTCATDVITTELA